MTKNKSSKESLNLRLTYRVEAPLKAVVKKLLTTRKAKWLMMVPNGFGKNAVDFLGTYLGHSFCLETKADGKYPTVQQWDWLIDTIEHGGSAAVVHCLQDVVNLLDAVDNGMQYTCPQILAEINKRKMLEGNK